MPQITSEKENVRSDEQQKKTFRLRNVLTALSRLPRIVRLVWDASPWLLLALTFCMLVQGILPVATVMTARLLIDGAVIAIRQGILQPIIMPFILQLSLDIINNTSNRITLSVQSLLQIKMQNHLQYLLYKKASALDLAFFEDSSFHDRLRVASDDSISKPISLIFQTFDLGRSTITLISLLGLLLQLDWWLVFVALLIPIPAFIAQARFGMETYWMNLWQAPEKRQQMYISYLLTNEANNKELKLFNLGDFFLGRFRILAHTFYQRLYTLQISKTRSAILWSLLSVAANAAIYLYIALKAVSHHISLGALSQYTLAVSQAGQNVQSVLEGLSNAYEHSLFIDTLFAFMAYEPHIVSPALPAAIEIPQMSKGLAIEFRHVSYTYPGKTEPALKDVSFMLRAGETAALVGQNGAGKTTLVKLLTRLYDPDEGEILIEGRNIKEYELSALREQMGVIFQDFVKYSLPAFENIGLGKVEFLHERPLIEAAAYKSGADAVMKHLPKGYETILGRTFDKGVDLSGGEWQKIALSRAFMRDASILVLDEPTSALDAEAEYDIFTRFRYLTEGKTTIFISHRFSTVRLADHIFVIEHGNIIEQGSHRDLMELGGRYSELFLLQAEAYRQ